MPDPKKLIAVLVIIFAFFAFLWEIHGFHTGEQVKSTVKPKPVTEQAALINTQSALFKTPLFGSYIPTNLSTTGIKQSMLNAQVMGIMFADNEKDSQVIIRLDGGEEHSYFIGDALPSGAIIKRITKKSIIVLHHGVLESLSLPDNKLTFDAPAKPLLED